MAVRRQSQARARRGVGHRALPRMRWDSLISLRPRNSARSSQPEALPSGSPPTPSPAKPSPLPPTPLPPPRASPAAPPHSAASPPTPPAAGRRASVRLAGPPPPRARRRAGRPRPPSLRTPRPSRAILRRAPRGRQKESTDRLSLPRARRHSGPRSSAPLTCQPPPLPCAPRLPCPGIPHSRHVYLGLYVEERDAARAYDTALVGGLTGGFDRGLTGVDPNCSMGVEGTRTELSWPGFSLGFDRV
jgi:hypothetical protein